MPSIMVRLAGDVFSFERAVLGGADAAVVHDMRVAARRLRAVLRLFRKGYGRPGFKAQVATLSALIRALGKVRDCDIILSNLDGLRRLLPEDPHRSLDEIIARQRLLREAHALSLKRLVGETFGEDARGRFLAFAFGRPVGGGFLHRSLREAAREMLPALLEETQSRRHEVVSHPGRIGALHEMRIGARPLRYLMEAFSPAFGPAFAKRLKELKDFLDVAGDIHDRDVMIEMLAGRIRTVAAAKGRHRGERERARAVRLAKLAAAQRAARRTLFREFRGRYRELAKGKFRRRLLRSIE